MIRIWNVSAVVHSDNTDNRFSIELYEVSKLGVFVDQLTDTKFFTFNWLNWIKLPAWKLVRDEGNWYTLEEWYGDLGTALSLHITHKLFQFCWRRTKHVTSIRITEEQARNISPLFVDEILFYAEDLEEDTTEEAEKADN